MENFFKKIFPSWLNISIDYNWRGLIAMSQKLTPSIGNNIISAPASIAFIADSPCQVFEVNAPISNASVIIRPL